VRRVARRCRLERRHAQPFRWQLTRRGARGAASTSDYGDGYPRRSLLNAFRRARATGRRGAALHAPPRGALTRCRRRAAQVAVANHGAAVGSYTQALAEAVAAFQQGVQTSPVWPIGWHMYLHGTC
jgi:hypothetical protein